MYRYSMLALTLWMLCATAWAQPTTENVNQQIAEAMRRGAVDEAIAAVNNAIEAGNQDLNLVMMRASLYEEQQAFDKAIADLNRLIQAAPDVPDAYLGRARIQLRQGKLDAALADVQRVQERQSNIPEAMFLRGALLYLKGDDAGAQQACNSLLNRIPRQPMVYLVRGLSKLRGGDVPSALDDLNVAWTLNPAYPLVLAARAKAKAGAKDSLGAQQDASLACALLPELCDADATKADVFRKHLYTQMPASNDWACGCCKMYNDRFRHMEGEVQKTLAAQAKHERTQTDKLQVYKNFGFTDRYVESGIRFVHQITIDSGKNWKPVHYDHGNGVAAADVNGDGHLDLYFVTQIGGNELWLANGDGTYRDGSEKAGIALNDRIGVGAAFADIDNDGDADLYATSVRGGNVLFENNGKGVFKDITDQAGLTYSGHSSGAMFVDVDNDGLLDLLLTNVGTYTFDEKGPGGFYVGREDAFSGHLFGARSERSILYRNKGDNRFEDVSAKMGFIDEGWSGDALFTDINGDRYPDLYMLNMQGDDRYWENLEGERFEDNREVVFPKTPWGSMGGKFFDANNDGAVDLYLTDMHSDMSQNITPEYERLKSTMMWSDSFLQGGDDNIFGNAFYENAGDGRFRETSDAMNLENYWPWGLSTGDLNADGFQDVFVSASMNHPFRYSTNAVFLNNKGKSFVDSAFLLGVEPRPRSVKPWFTVDCDGSDKDSDYCTGREGLVAVWGAYGSRAAVMIDIDNDCDMDIVTNEFNAEPLVLVSNLSQQKTVNSLKINLQGTTSNRDGLGAKVQVKVGDRTLTQWMDGKLGYLAQSRAPLYFGLGDAKRADEVLIQWPSGKDQVIKKNLNAGSTLLAVEPK